MSKVRFIVPNFFTALSFCIGLFSIIVMIQGIIYPQKTVTYLSMTRSLVASAGWLILWCVLLDKLDGFAAKALNATTEFGAQFDSLADLISFGIAPGLLSLTFIYRENNSWFVEHWPLLIFSVIVYCLCAAIRLARFNAVDVDEFKTWFKGLPTTIAGAFITLIVLILSKYDILSGRPGLTALLPLLLIAAGLLMVSTLYLSKLVPRKNRFIHYFQIVNIVIAYLLGITTFMPEYLMFLILLYLSVGFIYGFVKRNMIEGESAAGA